MQAGDEIVQIGDVKNPIYDDLRTKVTLSDLQEGVEFTVRREGLDQPFSVTLHPKADLGIPVIGVDRTTQVGAWFDPLRTILAFGPGKSGTAAA